MSCYLDVIWNRWYTLGCLSHHMFKRTPVSDCWKGMHTSF